MPPQCHSSEKNLAAEDQTKAGGKALGEYVGQFIGDYSLQVGVALFVLAGLTELGSSLVVGCTLNRPSLSAASMLFD
jgi:hypothetical protein